MAKKFSPDKLKIFRNLSRELTVVENDLDGAQMLLENLKLNDIPVIGITGPPGAGKSTLVSNLLNELSEDKKSVAVLAVDPTSPFTSGSLLGDRVRMQNCYTNPETYIRSVATRGALGGLSGKIIEMTDILRSYPFDYILIETVGVGQSEVEIAELADITFVVLVPESGDEIQSIKAGIMEIADAFIVNKADREGAEKFVRNLHAVTHINSPPIFKTVATKSEGIADIISFIKGYQPDSKSKISLLAKKAWELIKNKRMAAFSKTELQVEIGKAQLDPNFNIYRFAESKVRNS